MTQHQCWNCDAWLAFGTLVCADCLRALIIGGLSIAFTWAISRL